jgi:antitoxin MazE
MKTKVQKWGNSLALRIPKPLALDAGLRQNTDVNMSLVDGKLVITPLSKSKPTLDQLLANITDENLHSESDTDTATGNEIW